MYADFRPSVSLMLGEIEYFYIKHDLLVGNPCVLVFCTCDYKGLVIY